MKIPIAQAILKETLQPQYSFLSPPTQEAIQLGIEALKEVNALRKVLIGLGQSLLPEETK